MLKMVIKWILFTLVIHSNLVVSELVDIWYLVHVSVMKTKLWSFRPLPQSVSLGQLTASVERRSFTIKFETPQLSENDGSCLFNFSNKI
jgi:regulation of enolase protein 1 (concanavalin A-like superfamily)